MHQQWDCAEIMFSSDSSKVLNLLLIMLLQPLCGGGGMCAMCISLDVLCVGPSQPPASLDRELVYSTATAQKCM